jgi:hypothetical protein
MVENNYKRLAIFDLDGTLINVDSVRHHVEGKNKNFPSFHNESLNCPPFENVKNLNNKMHALADVYIAIVTGREEKYRNVSEQWLILNKISYNVLLMRKDNDYRKNVIIKREIYESIESKLSPFVAIDDTSELRNMWKDIGFSIVYDPQKFIDT